MQNKKKPLVNSLVLIQPPPMPRPRSKIDSLIFLTETFKSSNREEAEPPVRDLLESSKSGLKEAEAKPSGAEVDVAPTSPKNVERPVDLYKVFTIPPFCAGKIVEASFMELCIC